jgi:hypothetical protein
MTILREPRRIRQHSRRTVRPAPRSIRVVFRPEPGLPGHVRIKVGSCSTDYTLERLTVDPDFEGEGWQLTKCSPVLDGEDAVYHLLLAFNGQDHSCDCRGHQAHGHCKHVDGLGAAIQAGKL